MGKIFTFYDHKGGVSKITTSFNVGAYLAKEKKKKVLLVDVDPQSNLSELFFSYLSDNDEISGTSIYPNLKLLKGDFNFSQAEIYFGNEINQAITENIHE